MVAVAGYFLIGIEAFLHRKLGQRPADEEDYEIRLSGSSDTTRDVT